MKETQWWCLLLLGFLVSRADAQTAAFPHILPNYEPTWSSLRTHRMPEWMDGMKFGIYCHWGPQTVQHASGDEGMTTMQALEEWTGE